MQKHLLTIYLSDHLSGATGVVQRLSQMTSQDTDLSVHDQLVTLTSQITHERSVLQEMLKQVGVRPQRHKLLAARLAEAAGRLKLNGRVFSRSPLTPLLEIEAIRAGVTGKLSLWQTLAAHADTLGLDGHELAELERQAASQLLVLEQCHDVLARDAFAGD